jgi:hypothetical protein
VFDDILIEIVAAVVVAVIGSVTYAIRVRRRRGGSVLFSPPAGAESFQVTQGVPAQGVPPQFQGVIDQAMRAAADGRVDADEEAAIRAAALAAGAKGVAFQTTTEWKGLDALDGLPAEHLGPPPPGPAPAPPPAGPPPAPPA